MKKFNNFFKEDTKIEDSLVLYKQGVDYLKSQLTAPPYNFRWNPKDPILPHGTKCVFAVRDNKVIPPFEPFTVHQVNINGGLPVLICDYPSFTWYVNLSSNYSVVCNMINKSDRSPFYFNSGNKPMTLSFVRSYEIGYNENRPAIYELENDSMIRRDFLIFDFFEKMKGTKAERVIRTIEFASQFIRDTKGYWDYEDEAALAQLKMEFLDDNQLSMKDWAKII